MSASRCASRGRTTDSRLISPCSASETSDFTDDISLFLMSIKYVESKLNKMSIKYVEMKIQIYKYNVRGVDRVHETRSYSRLSLPLRLKV